LAKRELEEVGLVSASKISAAQIHKLPISHPVLDVGHKKALDEIQIYLCRFSNLHLAGRHARFLWDGQADNIVYGQELAKKLSENHLEDLNIVKSTNSSFF
jgi:protoporphyrinogen oxidase